VTGTCTLMNWFNSSYVTSARVDRGSTPPTSSPREGEGKGGEDPHFFLDNSSTACDCHTGI